MTREDRKAIYEKYARLRDKQGLTDYRVAKTTGVTTVTLTNWKQGNYVPKSDKLKPIAELLGVEVTYFL